MYSEHAEVLSERSLTPHPTQYRSFRRQRGHFGGGGCRKSTFGNWSS